MDPYTGNIELVSVPELSRPGVLSPDGRFFIYRLSDEQDFYLKDLLGEQSGWFPGACDSDRRRPDSYPFSRNYTCLPLWSPNSEQLFWDDYRGLWTSNVNDLSPHLLLTNEEAGELVPLKFYELIGVSPDGRYLLIFIQTIDETIPAVFDIQLNQLIAVNENIRPWQWRRAQWINDLSLILAHIEEVPQNQSSKLVLHIQDTSLDALDEIAIDLSIPMALRDVQQMSNGFMAFLLVGNNNSASVRSITDNQGFLVLDLATKEARWFSLSGLDHAELSWDTIKLNWLPDSKGVMVSYGSSLWLIPDDFSIVYDMSVLAGSSYDWLLPP
jgi:hypothetical protein